MTNPLNEFNNNNAIFRVTGASAEPVTLVVSCATNVVRVYVWASEVPLVSIRKAYTDKVERGLDAGIRALLESEYGSATPGFNFNVSSGMIALGNYARERGIRIEAVSLSGVLSEV